MATRRPRGGRPWFRGRSGPHRRPRAHHYSFQPPRNVMEAVNLNTETSSSDTLDFMPLHDACTSPNTRPQHFTNSSTDSVAFEQPPTANKPINSVTSPPPKPTSPAPKPLMSSPTQSNSPAPSKALFKPPQTCTSTAALSTSACVSDDTISRTDGSVSPTDQYLYGLDSSDMSMFDDSSSLLGKRKGHPLSDELDGGTYGDGVSSEGGDEVVRDKGAHNKNKVESPVVAISQEEIMEVNKRAIGVIGLITNERFLCNLCLAQLNSRKNLQKHVMANEHIRRVSCLLRDDLEKAYRFCKVCYVKCLNDEVYSQHLNGRKHLKNVQISEKIKVFDNRPVGPILDQLLKEEVVEEGDGLSLGLSPSMMKFFSLQGPFIGLQYAEEVGTPNEVNPKYNCTLCKIMTDAGNHYLHFTSTAHRLNVLKLDYPEKHQMMRRLMSSSDKKSDISGKLKDIVAEIEAREGRKVELIKRKILKESLSKAKPSGSATSGSSSGNLSSISPVSKRGRGSSSSSRGRDWSPWGKGWTTQGSYSLDTSPFTHTQRGGHQEGNRGRGWYNFNHGGIHQTPTSALNSNYYDFSESSGYTGTNRYTGGLDPSGYQSHQPVHVQQQAYGQCNNEYVPNPTASNEPSFQLIQTPQPQPPQPLMSFTGQPTPQTPSFSSSSFHIPPQTTPSLSSPLSSHGQWPPSQPPPTPQPPVALRSPSLTSPSFHAPLQDSSRLYSSSAVAGTDRGQYGLDTPVFPGQQFGGGQFSGSGSGAPGFSGNEHQMYGSIQKLANAQIDNEDDAEKALQLSSALTQALLAYRIKKVSSSSNPISSLLNTLHAVRGTPSQFPQQHELTPNLHKYTSHH